MNKSKKLVIALGIVVSAGVSSASAQIYVHVRPIHAVVIRTEAPSPRHVWINEDWRERNGSYEYNGGRWEAPPHPGYRYSPGRWNHGPHGDTWRQGHWHR